MNTIAGIVCLVASLVLLPCAASQQAAQRSPQEPLETLGSGSSQHVLNVIHRISHDESARTLYRHLFATAGSEPTSQRDGSSIAKASAFVLLVGLDSSLLPLSSTQREYYRKRTESLIGDISPEVSPLSDEFQWRAVELMQFSSAYEFYRTATRSRDFALEELLIRFAENACARLDQPIIARNNLSIKLAAALGYCALVLRDIEVPEKNTTPQRWLRIALDQIRTTMWHYQSDSTGIYGYSEGPYYFRYAMMNLLPFFLAFDAVSGGASFDVEGKRYASPLREAAWERLFDWISVIRMPDGTLPPFDDTYMGTLFPELAVLGALVPKYRNMLWSKDVRGDGELDVNILSSELSRTFDFRAEYLMYMLAASNVAAPPRTRLLPDAGYAIFRANDTNSDLYFTLIGKHGIARTHRSPIGGGHKHANEGAFVLYYGGELLILEPGYHSSAARDSLIYGRNHNVILIDGKGPDSTSFGNFLVGADAFISDTLTGYRGGMTSIRTSYQDADIERRAYVINDQFIVLRDFVESSHERDFTHQIHGNGDRDNASCMVSPEYEQVRWIGTSASVSASVSTIGASRNNDIVTRLHAPGYKRFAHHDALYTTVRGSNALFHSILVPHNNELPVSTVVLERCTAHSAMWARRGGTSFASVAIRDGEQASVSIPGLGSLYSDAKTWNVAYDSDGTPITWLLDEGRILKYESGRTIISSTQSLRAMLCCGTDGLDVHIRDARSLEFALYLPYVPSRVSGEEILSWDFRSSMLYVTLASNNADIRIDFSSTTSGVHARSPDNRTLAAPWPNPVSRSDGFVTVGGDFDGAVPATLFVVDALGRTRATRYVDKKDATLQVDVDNLEPGTYFLLLTQTRTISSRKFIVY